MLSSVRRPCAGDVARQRARPPRVHSRRSGCARRVASQCPRSPTCAFPSRGGYRWARARSDWVGARQTHRAPRLRCEPHAHAHRFRWRGLAGQRGGLADASLPWPARRLDRRGRRWTAPGTSARSAPCGGADCRGLCRGGAGARGVGRAIIRGLAALQAGLRGALPVKCFIAQSPRCGGVGRNEAGAKARSWPTCVPQLPTPGQGAMLSVQVETFEPATLRIVDHCAQLLRGYEVPVDVVHYRGGCLRALATRPRLVSSIGESEREPSRHADGERRQRSRRCRCPETLPRRLPVGADDRQNAGASSHARRRCLRPRAIRGRLLPRRPGGRYRDSRIRGHPEP